MSIFKEVANQIGKIDIDRIIQNIMNYDFVQDFVKNIVQERLEETGIDSKGSKMRTDLSNHPKFGGQYGAYAGTTEGLKKYGLTLDNEGKIIPSKQGVRPYKRVTLNQEGDFYKSWFVTAKKTFVNISAQFEKADGSIYENFTFSYSSFKEFETAILNMDEKEFEIFVKKIILPEFLGILNYEITK